MRAPLPRGSTRVTQRMKWMGHSLSATSTPSARPSSQWVTRSTTRPLGTRSHERRAPTPVRCEPSIAARRTPGLYRSTASRSARSAQTRSGRHSAWTSWWMAVMAYSTSEYLWSTSGGMLHKRILVKRAEQQAALAFKALGEPRRVEIMRLLRAGPRAVGEIAAEVDVTQQAASQHLAEIGRAS